MLHVPSLQALPGAKRILTIIPVPRSPFSWIERDLSAIQNVSILFTEGILSTSVALGTFPWDCFNRWDTLQCVAGFLFKACFLSQAGRSLFYSCSDYALTKENLLYYADLLSYYVERHVRKNTFSIPERSCLFNRELAASSFYKLSVLKESSQTR